MLFKNTIGNVLFGVLPIASKIYNNVKENSLSTTHFETKKPEEASLYRFLNAQLENLTKNNWVPSVVGDLITADIQLKLNKIADLSEEKYKYLCKQKVSKLAFKYLIEK